MARAMTGPEKPLVVITGVGGTIGTALVEKLGSAYTIAGLDLNKDEGVPYHAFQADLTSRASVRHALQQIRASLGTRIASVIHLAAYFDFTGKPHPLYRKLNVDGTRLLLEELQEFEVEQFIYSGTMLVHEPARPGERIDESAPIAPKWAYPRSKAAAEDAIRSVHGKIPYVLLHLAGVYNDRTGVPTLSHQIARIYERDFKSHVYSGDPDAGQSLVHEDDMTDAVCRAIERRTLLPGEATILIGEEEAISYAALQDELGCLIHGADEWKTLVVPEPLAKAGAWLEATLEPVVPDDFDQGEKPFIRPFMIDMASDHYALDISRAEDLLGWRPRHRIRDALPRIVAALKSDPARWYAESGITAPDWLQVAAEKTGDAEGLRLGYEARCARQHRDSLWAHYLNLGLGLWLLTAPTLLAYTSGAMVLSDRISGALVLVLGLLALERRMGLARWGLALVGLWVLFAPLVFWAPTPAAYLNDTLVGALVVGLATLVLPTPGIDPVAEMAGPVRPKGWDFSPSGWYQRLPIIALALVGFYISRNLAAYQLGHVEGVWDPFFAGVSAGRNGTESIVTSSVSEAWPVADGGLGALTYLIEILTGILGSTRRWRTMPWLVLLFGFLIVPLGIVSITFIVIQPILIGTWCTLCLIAAAAMLVQIPYSLDELFATGEFLWRRTKAGRPFLRILLRGDTDDGGPEDIGETFERPVRILAVDMWKGGLTLPWNLVICLAIGIWLMFTRLTLGAEGAMANADHLIGSLVVTVTVIALGDLARAVRFLNIPLGAALFVTPFVYDVSWPGLVASLVAGLALVALSLRRGPVSSTYGRLDRIIV